MPDIYPGDKVVILPTEERADFAQWGEIGQGLAHVRVDVGINRVLKPYEFALVGRLRVAIPVDQQHRLDAVQRSMQMNLAPHPRWAEGRIGMRAETPFILRVHKDIEGFIRWGFQVWIGQYHGMGDDTFFATCRIAVDSQSDVDDDCWLALDAARSTLRGMYSELRRDHGPPPDQVRTGLPPGSIYHREEP